MKQQQQKVTEKEQFEIKQLQYKAINVQFAYCNVFRWKVCRVQCRVGCEEGSEKCAFMYTAGGGEY